MPDPSRAEKLGRFASRSGAVSWATWSWLAKKQRELGRQVGVLFQKGAAIRRLARLVRLEIIRDDLIEPLLSIVGMLAAPVG